MKMAPETVGRPVADVDDSKDPDVGSGGKKSEEPEEPKDSDPGGGGANRLQGDPSDNGHVDSKRTASNTPCVNWQH